MLPRFYLYKKGQYNKEPIIQEEKPKRKIGRKKKTEIEEVKEEVKEKVEEPPIKEVKPTKRKRTLKIKIEESEDE